LMVNNIRLVDKNLLQKLPCFQQISYEILNLLGVIL
jgi:hypothetical protein